MGKSNFVNLPIKKIKKEEFIKKAVGRNEKKSFCFSYSCIYKHKIISRMDKTNASEIEFLKAVISLENEIKKKFLIYPLNDKGKTQSGTKDSMIVVLITIVVSVYNGTHNISYE
jgi:hypothetical protein